MQEPRGRAAGAYWHGDQNSDQPTRVYGTCFADKEGPETYLKFLEEATKLAGLDYILNPGEGAFYGPKSLQTERRDEMLAFRHLSSLDGDDRGQQRTPSASSLNSP